MSCERAIDAGAYALGALEQTEAADYAAHMRGCAECRFEVAQLQGVVNVLPAAAPQLAAPIALRERIMRDVRSEAELLRAAGPEADRPRVAPRRGWRNLVTVRPALAAALGCGLLAIGVGVGVALNAEDEPATRTVSARVMAPGAKAFLRITGDRAALRVQRMPSPPQGEVYQVWFVKDDGKPIPTHTLFNVRDDGRANAEIDEPIDGVRQILVSAEPSGGSTAPTSDPVITAVPA